MSELFVKCPACDKKERHSIITHKGKEAVVKCSRCGALHYAQAKEGKAELMLVISKGGKAFKEFKVFDPAEMIKVGQTVTHRKRYEVRAIEDHEGGRVAESKASDARALSLAPYTKKLSISVHADGTTKAYSVELPKDAVVKKGDVIRGLRITEISTAEGEVDEAKAGGILAMRGEKSNR